MHHFYRSRHCYSFDHVGNASRQIWKVFVCVGTLLACLDTCGLCCKEKWLLIALMAVNAIPMFVDLKARGKSTRIFTIHIGLSIVLMVLGVLCYEWSASRTIAGAGIVMLVAAVLIRSGCAPLHCWITDLFENAAFVNALLFLTPLVGAYAAMRLVVPIAPDWALRSIASLSLVTALYASCMAIVQADCRRFFCFLFISHSSLVLVGLETASDIGLTGALCVWFSVALSLTGLGLTLRCVEARTGPLSLTRYYGLYSHMPQFASFFLLTGLSTIGFPFTIGFTGTELLVEAGITLSPWIGGVVVVSTALNGIAILKSVLSDFYGYYPSIDDRFGNGSIRTLRDFDVHANFDWSRSLASTWCPFAISRGR